MKRIYGVDVGTGNIVEAHQTNDKKIEINSMRNMFLSVKPDILKSYDIANTNIDYVEQIGEDGEVESIAILSEDAYVYANMFNKKVRRPMVKGVLSSSDVDAMEVITLMFEKLIGRCDKEDGYLVYSVPAQAVDAEMPPVLYHEKVFNRIFKSLGYEAKPLNEGLAVIFSQAKDTNFTGIGISFGTGLTNVCLAYKGTSVFNFSVAVGGDWIDQNVSESTGILKTRACAVKEKEDMDLMNPLAGSKKEKQVREAISFFYSNLIEHVIEVFVEQFNESAEGLEIDEKLPIILSGGTSMAKGFKELFEEVFSGYKDFPYEISEIRQASDPLGAVAHGNLIYALVDQQEDTKPKKSKKEE